MILYITEKASVGRALAAVLSGASRKGENCIHCGDDVVAWASGHLLRLYDPDEYDAKYEKWSLADLPILPAKWKKKVTNTRAGALLKGIKVFLKTAKTVVNAGDADREGQYLIDEILEYCGWKGQTKRLHIVDVNPDAVRKALDAMKENSVYAGSSRAGQGRAVADWLAGMNLTRYCTLSVQDAGYDVLFSVGRVQTPTLGLVVKRDREIEGFVSKPYYDLFAAFSMSGGRTVLGRWQPGPDQGGLDDDGRLISRDTCLQVSKKVDGANGEITEVKKERKRQTPPLPYSLAALQMDLAKRYDITDATQHVQALYEQGYTTYPRSDCRYIPEGQRSEARKVLDAIAVAPGLNPTIQDVLKAADVNLKSPAWNDAKVTEHHAIVPTLRAPLAGAISDTQRKVYGLIAMRYAVQFLPNHEYEQTTVDFSANDERFRATGRVVLVPGWKLWAKDETEDDAASLPSVEKGEFGKVKTEVVEKKTAPPKRFSYDSLLAAMNGIHAYVSDPEIKKKLREVDGIGTAATQEGILAKLLDAKRGYLKKEGKQIVSTATGRALIDVLSSGKGEALTKPDLTALWERKLAAIEQGTLALDAFEHEVSAMVSDIVREPLAVPETLTLPGRKGGGGVLMTDKKCLTEGCEGMLRRLSRKDGKGDFYKCPVCETFFDVDEDGEPKARPPRVEADCPKGCGRKAVRHEGKYGPYWRCECSPDETFKDADGKPVVKEKLQEKKCPAKGCKGTVRRYPSKYGDGYYWRCSACQNFFDDIDGEPKERKKAADKQGGGKK